MFSKIKKKIIRKLKIQHTNSHPTSSPDNRSQDVITPEDKSVTSLEKKEAKNPQDRNSRTGSDDIYPSQEALYNKYKQYKKSLKKGGSSTELSQDMAALVNNPKDSDIQFKVGGGDISAIMQDGETIYVYDESAAVTIYAHSRILRSRSQYFDTMFDEDKNWKESSKGVISKPNVSPSTFLDVLYYIYTGSVHAEDFQSIAMLIIAADEMDIEGLSIVCQNELIGMAKYTLPDIDDDDDDSENGEVGEALAKQLIPLDVALTKYIFPFINFASTYSLLYLSQNLQKIIASHMPTILKSQRASAVFMDKISSEDLVKIIASDDLRLGECCVWDLALDWACRRAKFSKTALKKYLRNAENEDEKLFDGTNTDSSQLDQLKATLAPLLSVIRYNLLGEDDYPRMMNTIKYLDLQERLMGSINAGRKRKKVEHTGHAGPTEKKTSQFSSIIFNNEVWRFLGEKIFETGGITGCRSFYQLRFELLFRASENNFLATTFHQNCDYKGPTIVLVRGDNDYKHFFGGVNFNNWKSDGSWSSSSSNFLFSIPDDWVAESQPQTYVQREEPKIFRIKDETQAPYSSHNNAAYGPCFGHGVDLFIADSANTNTSSYSYFASYDGIGASNTVLAGQQDFKVLEYEVFAIYI